jgi:hypothetical protein
MVLVPREAVREVQAPADQVLRFLITAGVGSGGREGNGPAADRPARRAFRLR